MLQSIWQDLQQQFRSGNRVTQLIIVNIVVFVVIELVALFSRGLDGGAFGESLANFFAFSSDWRHNLTHPWTVITYAFLHAGLGHIFWNLLLFYWFGRIVGDMIGDKYVLPLYFLGAVAGGLLFWGTSALGLYQSGTFIVGASASVMAFIVAAAFYAPDYVIRLILIGEVRLKYIALAILLIDIFAFGRDANTGGHVAHLGGMIMGYVFVTALGSGHDLAAPINGAIDRVRGLFTGAARRGAGPARRRGSRPAPQPRPTLAYREGRPANSQQGSRPTPPPADESQERLDGILEKIKARGMDSLSAEERAFLSSVSRRG